MLFDFLLVSMGLLTAVLESTTGSADDSLGPIMVLRVLRLLKLARAVRLFSQFKVMWMLVRGLLSSATTMCHTFILMFLILYIFASLAIEMITKDTALRSAEPEYEELVAKHFPDLFTTMITLVYGLHQGLGDIYRRMIKYKPAHLSVFFVSYILVVMVCLLNLVTAVIVEGALEQAR